MLKNNYKFTFILISIFLLVVDQLAKYFVNISMSLNESVTLIPNVISLEKVYNPGAAFSIMQNATLVLIFISLAILTAIFSCVFRPDSKPAWLEMIAFAFVTGGATGNLLDRILNMYVIDFIKLDFINFPIFNFADICINIGVIILVVSLFIYKDAK